MTKVPPWEPTELEYKYLQFVAHIEARIEAGDLQPGQRLPPERELAEEYELGFHTIRRGMEVLRERGLVRTLQGHGNYVLPREGG